MDVTKYTDDNFEAEVVKSTKPVLVDFWADWCTPCHMLAPTIDEIASEYGDKIKVGKLNVDENPQTPGTFGIMSLPTVLLFKDGQPVKTFVGVQGKEEFKKAIDELLS
ncbi:MAG TPA: thioredoxin [Candidatus Levybacteria bacterium]|nr:thioredoxin [Candidatus Levybacteria bacterium]